MELLQLKRANCKNCYKCIRHCPVKSIRFSGNQAYIISEECIYCGQCFVVCPQNAKVISDSIEATKTLLAGDAPVIASIAPSFIANFDGIGIQSLENALKALGFAAAEETALGATTVKREYETILKNNQQDVVISSCCHTINLLVQKYFPAAVPCLAPVITPMHAHCQDIKERIPEAKTVFIGPCVSKKEEALHTDGAVDIVMTFEELSSWLREENIPLAPASDQNNQSRARFFPTTGGIVKSMDWPEDSYGYQVLALDGLEHCIAALKDIEQGNLTHCFIEMSACAGGCIGGPVMEKYHASPIRDYTRVAAYAGTEDFPMAPVASEDLQHHYTYQPLREQQPSPEDVLRILQQMGKTDPSHELNCGSCGYDTCREKAVAVFQGKADFSMCLPFLTDKAESFSDNIIRNTPNGILVLNGSLEIQQINRAACGMLSVPRAQDALGEPVVRLLDPTPFYELQEQGETIRQQRAYLAEYRRYIDYTILYEEDYQIFICIMSDITQEMEEKQRKEAMSMQTVEVADRVIEKQMRIVQEIASLLGETTAETKVALTKLKESITDE